MEHSLIPLNIYQFLFTVHQTIDDQNTLNEILLSFQSPRFSSVSSIHQRWSPLFSQWPELFNSFNQLFSLAEQSLQNDQTLQRTAEHYPLIYRVSCFLDSPLLDLFIRCLCLDCKTPIADFEIRNMVFQFLKQLDNDIDTKEMIIHILIEDDKHDYFNTKDWIPEDNVLDLDRIKRLLGDQELFEQVMATIQLNTFLSLPWIQDVYEMTRHLNIWDQLAPILQSQTDSTEYVSYEDYVQKNFLDDGGKEYLDGEIDRSQVEHMFENLKM
ncbi:unnamed protein product [Rhizopus stolonifer]